MSPSLGGEIPLPQPLAIPTPDQKSTTTITITSLPPSPTTPSQSTNLSIALVLNPTLITTDFDLLRFSAAAYDQLPKDHQHSALDPKTLSTSLISSPYNNPSHYLDLSTLPLPSLLFAKALTALAPLTPAYATTPYAEALNFNHVLSVLRELVNVSTETVRGFEWPETSFYVVVFSSELKPRAQMDEERLYKLDYESHREACESGGLLKYWFGKTSEVGRRNLATCMLSPLSPLYLHIVLLSLLDSGVWDAAV